MPRTALAGSPAALGCWAPLTGPPPSSPPSPHPPLSAAPTVACCAVRSQPPREKRLQIAVKCRLKGPRIPTAWKRRTILHCRTTVMSRNVLGRLKIWTCCCCCCCSEMKTRRVVFLRVVKSVVVVCCCLGVVVSSRSCRSPVCGLLGWVCVNASTD